jgi:SAM-dependent methyltransferase
MSGLYTDPAVYDILHAPGTAAEIDAHEKVERTLMPGRLKKSRLWFEPACGSGRYLKVAAGRGRKVAGFDLDPGMIAYAAERANLKRANLFTADMNDFSSAARRAGIAPASADFAFQPVNSIRHLDSDKAMLAHLDQMARILKPGALYVVGISLTNYDWLEPEEDVWTGARGRCRVHQLVNFLPPEPGTKRARAETVLSHLTITRPRGTEHRDATYDLRTYDVKQWNALVKRSPLERAGSFDAFGDPLAGRVLNYQFEALCRPE